MTFLMKLVGLSLIALLTLMEWLGIFALSISQFITNKLAALIFFIACCCLLFGKATFREAAAIFAGSFCVFILPYAAEWILERISDLNRCVKDLPARDLRRLRMVTPLILFIVCLWGYAFS